MSSTVVQVPLGEVEVFKLKKNPLRSTLLILQ